MPKLDKRTREYIKQIKNGNEDEGLKGLIGQYTPLLYSTAYSFRNTTEYCALEVDDLYNAGVYGLYRAAKTYDINRGAFPSYAKLLIRREVWNIVRENITSNNRVINFAYSLNEELGGSENLTLQDVIGENDPYLSKESLPIDDQQNFVNYVEVSFSKIEQLIIIYRLEGYQPLEIMERLKLSNYHYYELLKEIKSKLASTK